MSATCKSLQMMSRQKEMKKVLHSLGSDRSTGFVLLVLPSIRVTRNDSSNPLG